MVGKNSTILRSSGRNSGFNLRPARLLFLFLLLFQSVALFAQIDIQRYTTATDTFYWKRYIHIPKPPGVSLRRFSVSNSSKHIDAFLRHNLSQVIQNARDSSLLFPVKELKKYLFPVDINGDKLPDMIFNGTGGKGPEMVKIWLNRRDTFILIFEDYQYITKFRKTGASLVDLQTGDIGSGDDYLYFTRDYRVDSESENPAFVKGKQVVSYKYTEEPQRYYPVPIPFVAVADTMLVRASAARQDEPFNPKLDTFGNILAKYRAKARGVVLAYKSNGQGNDWFFVEIQPSTLPSASILYGLEKVPTFIRGWVSGRSIQLVP
ncbi:MAG: hypothetical protein ACOYNC_09430 [Bacteroidales bacterium]